MQDLMNCVADKFSSLLALPAQPSDITVLDRGFITQTALAIPHIEDQASISFSTSLISQCNEWLRSRFIVTTLVLRLPETENVRRLEQRLGRALTKSEQQVMRYEIERYAALTAHPDAVQIGLRMFDATDAPDTLAKEIISALLTMERN